MDEINLSPHRPITCKACPFALTDYSEKIQNLGCLPSSFEILQSKRNENKNWSCHENEKKICSGFVEMGKR